jgi:heat shock protein HtpX
VLAHELSHVVNRDILISSVAAAIGAVITWLSYLAWFIPVGNDDDEGGNPVAGLIMAMLAPIAATLIQLAVSRSREFGADTSGARITADPLAVTRSRVSLAPKEKAWVAVRAMAGRRT